MDLFARCKYFVQLQLEREILDRLARTGADLLRFRQSAEQPGLFQKASENTAIALHRDLPFSFVVFQIPGPGP